MRRHIANQRHSAAEYIISISAVCLIFAIMQGIHDNYGIMMNGIVAHTGADYASVSFVIAVGQIMYGVTQPIFGILALKRSNAFVLLCGIILMAAGLTATPFCKATWSLFLFFGILLPAGTGALCFGIVMGAVAPIIGEKRAAAASGIIQASAGIGDALMSPLLQRLTDWRGVTVSLPAFAAPILLMIPVVIWLGYKKKSLQERVENRKEGGKEESLFSILGEALHDRTYWCLFIGFSTCGFHMSIIETHLFSQYVSCGIPNNLASLALTVYGIFTMLGAVATGFLSQKFRMKNVLAVVYSFRVLIAISFLSLPKTAAFAFAATGLLGLTGDSTVPPTTGIIGRKVGVAKMAVVYGSIFIGHQFGAFVSAWLGGIFVETSLGYSALWLADLFLCLIAAIASYKIKD